MLPFVGLLFSWKIGNSGVLIVNTINRINIAATTATDKIGAHLIGSKYSRKCAPIHSAIK